MQYLLAIDQGTTSSRAVIFDETCQIKGVGQHEISQYFPEDGWVEHDPEQIWSTTLQSCFDALNQAQLSAQAIAGIGITNQRETSIIWDKITGKPVYRAIVWQDRRTTTMCENLKAQGYETLIHAKTGLLLDPYFSATKIAWILDNIAGVRQRAENGELLFGTIETYLLWRLTESHNHFTDVTNASRTLLFNIHTQEWDAELLALFNIPAALLPKIVDNCGQFGLLNKNLLGAAIPICALAGDQQAAAFGQACFQPGMIKSTYGTGCFMLVNTGKQPVNSAHKLLTTIQYRIGKEIAYGLEGSIFIAGAAVQWLRDNLHLIQRSSDIQALADQVADNGDVYFIPAFTGLGAPYWQPHARGLIAGLTRDTRAGHLARAALEAVCYQTRDLLNAMAEDGVKIESLRVDGGMTNNESLLQLLADISRVKVERSKIIETTALGISFMVGLELGIYSSLTEITKLWQYDVNCQPEKSLMQANELYKKWQYWVGKCSE